MRRSDIAKTLAHTFISSRLDYCNSLIFGTTNLVMCKLRAVQNAAAQLVSNLSRYEHLIPALMDLRLLPVCQGMITKLLF